MNSIMMYGDRWSEDETKRVEKNPRDKLTLFFGRSPIFSNYYPSLMKINGITFNCVEQFYQYRKSTYFHNFWIGRKILREHDPQKQKEWGSQIRDFNRVEWDAVSVDIMKTGVRAKFDQNRFLRQPLFNTFGTSLVEASRWDTRWGIGLSIHDTKAADRNLWEGTNLLGHILDDIRQEMARRYPGELNNWQFKYIARSQ